MSSIRLENLTKVFTGDVRAVVDLNLEVPHGEFMALLGPSGCGKTTTMNMIAGLEKPTAGEIYFDDTPVSRVAPGNRNVGFVFQNYAIFTHMTVRENLGFGLRVRRPRPSDADIERAVRAVGRTVGLSEQLDVPTARLSVNDLQKVALGRSMIVKPAIFLLDEPFSNLDAAFRGYMRAELKRIQADVGQTMVYVTHDQVEAMAMADRIAVMSQGELQQYGTPDELYNRPRNRFVAGFIGSVLMNFLPVAASIADGHAHVALPGTANPIDVSDRHAALGGVGSDLTVAIRPERIERVAADSAEATVTAPVTLLEPLGPRDIVHCDHEGSDIRLVLPPGGRPTIGERIGLRFPPEATHVIDDASDLVLR